MTSGPPSISTPAGGLVAAYAAGLSHLWAPAVYDELVDDQGRLREHWTSVGPALDELDLEDLTQRRDEAARLLGDDGVTYHPAGGGDSRSADIWRLDPAPFLLAGAEWADLERGLVQRARLLDLVLADVYGPRDLIRRGLLPPELVYGHAGFLRQCDGIRLPGPQQLFTVATDLVRHNDGQWYAVHDRTQAPSGAGYALENRVVVSRVLPALFRNARVQRLAPFFRTMRAALRAMAPPGTDTPRIVVLTPGPRSETAFEHAFLASHLGYPLVEGDDLRMREGRVWLKSIHGLEQVDVILRRVDSVYCDPLEFRPDSQLGVPGLVEACRLGSVSVVNTLGSGVLENPGLLAYLPRLAEELLGEPLRMPSTPTWWCGDAGGRRHVLARLRELVIKPISRGFGRGNFFGWELSEAERDDLSRQIEARPYAWVGQEPLEPSTAPTTTSAGLAPRRQILRTFAVAHEDTYSVMTGGLSRVSPTATGMHISNQKGALTKDVWVLASEPERLSEFWLHSGPLVEALEPAASTSARIAEDLFWLGRYAERAEATARLLRAVHDRFTEFHHGNNPTGVECLQTLLIAVTRVTTTWPGFTGIGDGPLTDARSELVALLVDADRPGTVSHSVRRMFDAAHAVRDQLSVDTFLVLGNLDREIAGPTSGFRDPEAEFPITIAHVVQKLLALSGLTAESMIRDPGWRLMDAGRRIERALQVTALIRATLTVRRSSATDSLIVESLLGAAESIITYRRRYRSQAQIETVLDLLLLDSENPRSLAYQIERLSADLRLLSRDSPARSAEPRRLLHNVATRLHAADTAELATVDGQDRRGGLDAFLTGMQDRLRRVADAIDAAYFTHPKPARPLDSVAWAEGAR